jgi:hypothetical protein
MKEPNTGGYYSPSPNSPQLAAGMKARRILRSLGEGGQRLRRISQDTPQLAAGSFIAGNDYDTAMVRGRYAWSAGRLHSLEVAETKAYQKRFFAKACPDPDLRYRSNSIARCSS